MEVNLSEQVKTKLHTMSRLDRERVVPWFDYLRNWEDDPFVRSHSVALDVRGRAEYMFRTSTDVRIFYTVDPQSKSISVVDVASKDTILAFGRVPAGVP